MNLVVGPHDVELGGRKINTAELRNASRKEDEEEVEAPRRPEGAEDGPVLDAGLDVVVDLLAHLFFSQFIDAEAVR